MLALVRSPVRQILPHLLRLLADPPDQIGMSELLEMCDISETPALTVNDTETDLTSSLYATSQLNVLRAKYALALWCRVSHAPNST